MTTELNKRKKIYMMVIFAAFVVTAVSIILVRTSADTNSQTVAIDHTNPYIDSINFSYSSQGATITSFSPSENTDRTLYIYGTVTADGGCSTINDTTKWSLDMYRDSVAGAESCTPSNSNCYDGVPATQLTLSGCSGGPDQTMSYEWAIPLAYYVDPTDAGTYAGYDWKARVFIDDGAGNTGSMVGSIEVATLRALDVTSLIDYGNLDPGDYSAEKTVTITNTGNSPIDYLLSANGPMTCSHGSIPEGNVHVEINSGFSYASPLHIITNTDHAIDASIPKRTAGVSSKLLYLILYAPTSGAAGQCSNTLQFTASTDN